MQLEMGIIVGGRYEIKEKIGSGGMAIVYRAIDIKLDRPVTFKVMREEHVTEQEFIKRFNIEAKAAARLSHPNIVNVYDYGQEDDVYYIVMEYVEGTTLKEVINKRAPFSDTETVGVAIQIAQALENAHANGIIHRDIKPQNILVTTDGKVKVTDFGIARSASSTTVSTGSNTMGSVHYFSPEQAKGRFVDARSDIYSLGIVMYEMTTGKIPYDGQTSVSVAMQHINEPLPDIKGFNGNVSPSLEKIILKATQKISTNRYESTGEMLNDLKRAITNFKGDFVRDEKVIKESPTVAISHDDISIIRNKSKEQLEKATIEDFYEGSNEENQYEEEYDEVYIDRATKIKVTIAAIVTGLVIVAIISAIALNIYSKNKMTLITVPNIIGLEFDTAEKIVKDLGLLLDNAYQDYDDVIPEGSIILQNYLEGDKVYKNTTIQVNVSLGSDKTSVPNAVNKEINTALVLFDDTFNVVERGEYSEIVPIGVVIRQMPEGNSMASRGSDVVLYVSEGQEIIEVKVPDLEGLTESQAINALTELGLVTGHISKAENATVPAGRVVTQLVSRGKSVAAGTIVGFVVSLGAPTPVPSSSPPPAENNQPPDATPNTSSNETVNQEEPKIRTKNLVIDPPLPEGKSEVTITVLKMTPDSTNVIYEKKHSVDDMPLTIEVTGEGKIEYQLKVDEKYTGVEIVDFSS